VSGLFLAEGAQAVGEGLATSGAVRRLLVHDVDAHADLIGRALGDGVPVSTLTRAEVLAVSDTVASQGVIAICVQRTADLPSVLATRPELLLCCDRVRDPGNAGTMIRCADAFGADAVLLSVGSVDPYNPKTVRASTGSLFHLPIVPELDLAEAVAACRISGSQVLAADGSGPDELPALGAELVRPTVWLMGNESWGLPAEVLALADRVVRVPIYGRAESLNLASAAAICLFATATAQQMRSRAASKDS
jgi:TrmH family RNA methyltransferase